MPLLGGTLEQLAKDRGTTVEALQGLNPNMNPNTTYSVSELNFGSPVVNPSPDGTTQTLIGEGIGPAVAPPPVISNTGYTRDSSGNVFDAQGNHVTYESLPKGPDGKPLMNLETLPLRSIADKLKNEGAVTTSETPPEQSQFYKDMEARLKKSDEQVSQLMNLYVPTAQEQKLQAEIDQIYGAAEAGINQEADRPATMGFITGAQASIERRANQKLAGLQRELTRLQGNREGQRDAIKAAFDIRRQSVQDAISLYKLAALDKIAIDERSGIAYFMNPITGEITSKPLPGFQPKPEEKIAAQKEYEYAVSQGFKGTFIDWMKEKASQFGTEGTTGDLLSISEAADLGVPYGTTKKQAQAMGLNPGNVQIVKDFNKDLTSWNLSGTREQFIRQLKARYPGIEPQDIVDKVYETYPDGYDKGL